MIIFLLEKNKQNIVTFFKKALLHLRMMPPFATVWDYSTNYNFLRMIPNNSKAFCTVIAMQEKKILARAFEIQKENLRQITHFSEMPYTVMFVKLFRIIVG